MRFALLLLPLAAAACGDASDVLNEVEGDGATNEVAPVAEAEGKAIAPYGNGVVTLESQDNVAVTVLRLEEALEAAGFNIIAKVDHQANAGSVDLALEPATVIFFGRPESGTPLMQESPEAALDLPQRMAVYVKDGQTIIAANDPVWLASRHGIIEQKQRIDTIRATLEKLAQQAAGNEPLPQRAENTNEVE